jgi:hypothetical protein
LEVSDVAVTRIALHFNSRQMRDIHDEPAPLPSREIERLPRWRRLG